VARKRKSNLLPIAGIFVLLSRRHSGGFSTSAIVPGPYNPGGIVYTPDDHVPPRSEGGGSGGGISFFTRRIRVLVVSVSLVVVLTSEVVIHHQLK
jgi:hypothetical protein